MEETIETQNALRLSDKNHLDKMDEKEREKNLVFLNVEESFYKNEAIDNLLDNSKVFLILVLEWFFESSLLPKHCFDEIINFWLIRYRL